MVEVVKTLGVDEAFEVNPSDRYFYKNESKDTIQKPGVKVIVSNKECKFHVSWKTEKRGEKAIKKWCD